MPKYTIWLLAALAGFLISGGSPLGAVVGLAAAVMYTATFSDLQPESEESRRARQRYNNTQSDFSHVLLVLTASIMRADGKVMRSELDYIRDFFNKRLGPAKTQELMIALRDMLAEEYQINDVCRQIRLSMMYPLRLELLHFLFGIAAADGQVNANELQELEKISAYMGISLQDFESIKAMFHREAPFSAYKILEIEPSASEEDIKKAYRKMAVKYHPDKVSHLGEEYQNAAKEKFQKVQEAYDRIKRERGIN